MDDDDKKISELDYFEVHVQLQILEHIANKGPLSEGDMALQRELEERDKVLIREKRGQAFDAAHAPDKEAWDAASRQPEFAETADALARSHLREDMDLIRKQKQDAEKFGPSKGLDDMQAREREIHAQHFDEERARYAREFLEQRKLAEELESKEHGAAKDKGHEFS